MAKYPYRVKAFGQYWPPGVEVQEPTEGRKRKPKGGATEEERTATESGQVPEGETPGNGVPDAEGGQ